MMLERDGLAPLWPQLTHMHLSLLFACRFKFARVVCSFVCVCSIVCPTVQFLMLVNRNLNCSRQPFARRVHVYVDRSEMELRQEVSRAHCDHGAHGTRVVGKCKDAG